MINKTTPATKVEEIQDKPDTKRFPDADRGQKPVKAFPKKYSDESADDINVSYGKESSETKPEAAEPAKKLKSLPVLKLQRKIFKGRLK